jgi:hypothetical protein
MTVMVIEQRHENPPGLVDAPLFDVSQCGPQEPHSVVDGIERLTPLLPGKATGSTVQPAITARKSS